MRQIFSSRTPESSTDALDTRAFQGKMKWVGGLQRYQENSDPPTPTPQTCSLTGRTTCLLTTQQLSQQIRHVLVKMSSWLPAEATWHSRSSGLFLAQVVANLPTVGVLRRWTLPPKFVEWHPNIHEIQELDHILLVSKGQREFVHCDVKTNRYTGILCERVPGNYPRGRPRNHEVLSHRLHCEHPCTG